MNPEKKFSTSQNFLQQDQIYRTYAAPITFQLSLLASIFRSRNTLVLNGKDLENSSKISDKNESWIVKAIVDYMV